MTGWMVFHGEIQLYDRQQDVGNQFDRSCISGQMARRRDRHRVYRQFNGKHVRVEGLLIPANALFGEWGLSDAVENYCARDDILIVQSITAVPPAPAP